MTTWKKKSHLPRLCRNRYRREIGKNLTSFYSPHSDAGVLGPRSLPETFECPDRWRAEIDLGLPPGVQVGDLLRNEQTMGSLRQVYLLAVQANSITDHLKRFDAVRVPESCRGVVEAQVAKLEAVRSVIWNTMISLAVSGIEMDENGLKALLDKQAGDSLALMEMEKVATALKMDETGAWAQEISAVVSSVTAPSASAPFINSAFEPEVPTPVLAPPPVVRQPEHSGAGPDLSRLASGPGTQRSPAPQGAGCIYSWAGQRARARSTTSLGDRRPSFCLARRWGLPVLNNVHPRRHQGPCGLKH